MMTQEKKTLPFERQNKIVVIEKMLVTSFFFFSHMYLTRSHTMAPFDTSRKEAFLKHCGKRRNCLNKQFLPFPTMFSTLSKTEIIIFVTFNLSSANAFNLVWSKILSRGFT